MLASVSGGDMDKEVKFILARIRDCMDFNPVYRVGVRDPIRRLSIYIDIIVDPDKVKELPKRILKKV